jgi:hypothetical protein
MSEKNSKIYSGIYELPVLNYDRFISTGQAKWLSRDGEEKKGVDYEAIWEGIESEIIEKMGVDAETQELLLLRNNYLIAEIDYMLEKTGRRKNDLNRAKRKLEETEQNEGAERASVLKSLLEIGRVMNFRLDPGTTTVAEYIEAREVAEEIVKQMNKKNKQNDY